MKYPPGHYTLDYLLHPDRLLRMASRAPRRRWRPRLVRLGHETCYDMYINYTIGSDDSTM